MNLNKLLFFLFIIFYLSLSQALPRPEDYFNARKLSAHNLYLGFGISLLNPPHSLKNSFAKDLAFQMSYRKEPPRFPPFFLSAEGGFRSQKFRSLVLSSGLRIPRTHRKTPVYFSLSLALSLPQPAFYLQPSVIFRAAQIGRKTGLLMKIQARYKLGRGAWWRVPSSIRWLAGLDMNI